MRDEVLVCGCCEEDLAVLARASKPRGLQLRTLENAAEFARLAVSSGPRAIVMGVEARSIAHLDLIPVIRHVSSSVPVIVVGEDETLDLERRAREKGIFYYMVHPIGRFEVEAVLNAAMRFVKG